MRHKLVFWSVFVFSITSIAMAQGMGTRAITFTVAGTNVQTRLYYPVPTATPPTRFGPWTLPARANAPLAQGTYPLVVISHGLGGNAWGHRLLAETLVKAGFIVGAVEHPEDLYRLTRPELHSLRPIELNRSIDAILADSTVGPTIDHSRIGAFGFSQGGLTVLRSVGGRVDQQAAQKHCNANADRDPMFCAIGTTIEAGHLE